MTYVAKLRGAGRDYVTAAGLLEIMFLKMKDESRN